MGLGLLVCHSHLPGGEITLPLSVHSFSTYLVSTHCNDCWAAQIKNRGVWGGPERLGRNDEGLVGAWEILESDPGSLQGGISGTGLGKRSHSVVTRPQGPQGPF